MIIARVVGNVVATQKQETHEGKKIITLSNYFKQHKPVVLVFGSFT